jgi:hypothetical protein
MPFKEEPEQPGAFGRQVHGAGNGEFSVRSLLSRIDFRKFSICFLKVRMYTVRGHRLRQAHVGRENPAFVEPFVRCRLRPMVGV